MKIVARSVFIAMLAVALAMAQNISSSLTGILHDPSGSALVGVDLTLVNQATGASFQAKSGGDGGFTFANVLAGRYNLTAKFTGFKSLETRDITVTAGEVRALGRLTMEIGEVRESVSITAEGASIQLSSSEKSGIITGSQLNEIAVRGRDFFTYLSTVPGVVDNFSQKRETSSPDAIRGTFINGQRENQKNLTVDGVTNLDTGSNSTIHFQPNMDAIAEVKILTSNYQAEFGRNGGGVITVITKGGGQEFHGSGYWNYRHESMNANSFFNNRSKLSKAPYRYRINGYSIGGPIYVPGKWNIDKSKLFFFWSQEYVGMKRDYGTRYANMPTALEREGDFSQSFNTDGSLLKVMDPTTGSQFPNNRIPADRISKLGQAMLNYFPAKNYDEPVQSLKYSRNYAVQNSGAYPKRQDMIRIDGNFWPSVQFYYRFIKDKDEQQVPYGLWVNGDLNFLNTPTIFGQPGKGHNFRLNKIFSPTLVNEFIFGKNHNNLYFYPVDPEVISRKAAGDPKEWYPNSKGLPDYMPNIRFGGVPTGSPLAAYGNIPYENHNEIYSFVNNLSKIFGKHTVKAGVYIERTQKYQVGNGNYRGNFNFSRDTNNPFDTGHSFANALTGTFQQYQEATDRMDGDWWFWNVEWYIQDNWRVNNRLTIDYGMRFYALPPWIDKNHTMASFDPTKYDPKTAAVMYRPALDSNGKRAAVDPISGAFASTALIGLFVPNSGNPAPGMVVGGVDGTPEGLYTNGAVSYGPRFGLAYDLTGNGKTALRAGFGAFKNRLQGNPTMNTNGQQPVAYTPTLWFGNLDTYASSPGVLGPSSSNMLYGENRDSTTFNFSFGIQHQIWNTVIDASYVGGQSRHLMVQRNINPIPMFARNNPANIDSTTGRPLPDNFLRPYTGHGDINYRYNGVNSNYNSLQLSASRRFIKGVTFGASYTWSKTMGVAEGDTSGISPYFAAGDRNYGPLPFDRAHVFVANYVWDLPKFGTMLADKRITRWMFDNWQVSGITSFITGAPFTPGLNTTDGMDFTWSSEGARIDVIGKGSIPKSEKTFERTFNTAAFARPKQGTFGNAGVNILNGPGVNNFDMSVSKRFPFFGESRWMQFRAEFFNAFNHTQFSGQDSAARFDASGKQTNLNFGAYNGARDPRMIQLSLRVNF